MATSYRKDQMITKQQYETAKRNADRFEIMEVRTEGEDKEWEGNRNIINLYEKQQSEKKLRIKEKDRRSNADSDNTSNSVS